MRLFCYTMLSYELGMLAITTNAGEDFFTIVLHMVEALFMIVL